MHQPRKGEHWAPLEQQPWFRGSANRAEAQAELRNAAVGTFVIRTSESQPGHYVATVVQERVGIAHILIPPSGSSGDHAERGLTRYCFGLQSRTTFSAVPELIAYYLRHPYQGTSSDVLHQLQGVCVANPPFCDLSCRIVICVSLWLCRLTTMVLAPRFAPPHFFLIPGGSGHSVESSVFDLLNFHWRRLMHPGTVLAAQHGGRIEAQANREDDPRQVRTCTCTCTCSLWLESGLLSNELVGAGGAAQLVHERVFSRDAHIGGVVFPGTGQQPQVNQPL